MNYVNRICPKCNNPNYVVSIRDFSKVFPYKCMNCNSYLLEKDFLPVQKDDNNGWISVKDKLPENKAVCLTYSPKGKMRVAEAFLPSSLPNSKFDPMECWWSTHGSGGARYVAVTHWMPLPEPPKEDA